MPREGGLKGVGRMTEDKELEDYFAWLIDEEINLWDIDEAFHNDKDFKMIQKILGEKQALFFKALIHRFVYAIFEWHNKEDEESHSDIRANISKLEARFRNHRHETSKTFCGKAEY